MLVGRDALAPVELDADLLQPEPLDRRRAADGDQHQIGFDRLALAEVDGQRITALLHLRALLAEVQRDSRRPNSLASSEEASSSSIGSRRGSISTIVTSEPNRCRIDANSQPMTPPPRITSRRGTSVCASKPVESTHSDE